MLTLSDLRNLYGKDTYLTETNDNVIIPWKPLCIKDYLEYDSQFRSGIYPPSILEDEIFKKCVLDSYLVKNIDKQKAGTVSLVATTIMQQSGPTSIEDFNGILNHSRNVIQQPIHQLVAMICRIFHAYKVEDIYAMDFANFVHVAALAESELLRVGLLQEPIQLFSEIQEEVKPKKPKIDIDKLKEVFEQQGITPPKPKSKETVAETIDLGSSRDNEDFVLSSKQLSVNTQLGNNLDDMPLISHQMEKEARIIYKDYIDKMNKGEKITPDTIKKKVAEKYTKRK